MTIHSRRLNQPIKAENQALNAQLAAQAPVMEAVRQMANWHNAALGNAEDFEKELWRLTCKTMEAHAELEKGAVDG